MKEKLRRTMKCCTTLVAVLVLVSISWTARAQMEDGTFNFPTDKAELPYNVSEVVSLIQESFEAPVETNKYALMIEEYANFPKLTLGTLLTKTQVKKVTIWVEEHPAAIEDLLIARKENYDIYFNPATTGSSK